MGLGSSSSEGLEGGGGSGVVIGALVKGKMVFGWWWLGAEEVVDLGADEVSLVGKVVAAELGLELLHDVV